MRPVERHPGVAAANAEAVLGDGRLLRPQQLHRPVIGAPKHARDAGLDRRHSHQPFQRPGIRHAAPSKPDVRIKAERGHGRRRKHGGPGEITAGRAARPGRWHPEDDLLRCATSEIDHDPVQQVSGGRVVGCGQGLQAAPMLGGSAQRHGHHRSRHQQRRRHGVSGLVHGSQPGVGRGLRRAVEFGFEVSKQHGTTRPPRPPPGSPDVMLAIGAARSVASSAARTTFELPHSSSARKPTQPPPYQSLL